MDRAKPLLLLLSTLLCLGLAELLARGLGLAPEIAPIEVDMPYGAFISSEDPVLLYQPKPGAGDINAYGIRDRDYPLHASAGTLRIVVLGDSVGFGLCSVMEGALPLDAVFSEVLERDLEARGRRAEVINLSVSGYNTAQETAFFEAKGLPLEPDLVLVAYVLNDHADHPSVEVLHLARDERFARYRALTRAMARNALLESHLIRALWYRLSDFPGEELPSPSNDRYAVRISEDFEPLRRLSVKHGFDVLVAIFPLLQRQTEAGYAEAWQHEVVARVAREKGFDALDLLPAFEAAGAGDLQRLRGRCGAMHPDERGHRVAAEAILERLISDAS
jgi:lysophospholipase L1-like esterase